MRALVRYFLELFKDTFALPPCCKSHRQRCVLRFVFGCVLVYLLTHWTGPPTN